MNNNYSTNIAVIDIGNSRLKMLSGNEYFTANYRKNWKQLLTNQLYELKTNKIYYSSVNKDIEKGFINLTNELSVTVFNAVDYLPNQTILKYDKISGVGNDRIFGILGALSLCEPPIITIDIGTAVTINFVSKDANFLGGAIFPGLHLQANALKKNTSGLKIFDLLDYMPGLGKNTNEAVTCGIYNNITGGIVQIIKNAIKNNFIGKNTPVFLTGGSAENIRNILTENFKIIYEKHLVLKGILSIIK